MKSKARSLMYPEGEPMPPPAVVPAVCLFYKNQIIMQ